jgi:hypothetical protein
VPTNVIPSIAGSRIGEFFDKPYWAVKLRSTISGNDVPYVGERWLCEMDKRPSALFNPNHVHYDWTLDLITTGDILRIEQLWMFCPRNPTSPNGNTATLFFKPEEAGTAFLFNISQQSMYGRMDHKIIGKVYDRQNGDCACFIWDDFYKCMSSPWHTNIYKFGTWRASVPGKPGGIAPIGELSQETIGLRL